jgi:hypothetical protein
MRVLRSDSPVPSSLFGAALARTATVLIAIAAVLTGAALSGSPAGAAPASEVSLTVTPNHGRATAMFTAQYRVVLPSIPKGTKAVCPVVQFGWDGTPLGAPVKAARQSGTTNVCVATLRARPPVEDRAAGGHQIEVPDYLGRGAQAVTYTIEDPADPSATADPNPTSTRRPPTAPATDPAGVGAFSPSDVAAPATEPSNSVLGAATQASTRGGGSAASWILIIGGLLVLGGIGIFGLLIYWMRRGDGGSDLDPRTDILPY